MAGRKPGGPKTGGRKKGSVNKTTKESREIIAGILSDNHTKFLKEFKSLEGKEFCKVYVDLIGYTTPRLKAVDSTLKFQDEINIPLIDWIKKK